jgi:SAM-dependent methyltransferase
MPRLSMPGTRYDTSVFTTLLTFSLLTAFCLFAAYYGLSWAIWRSSEQLDVPFITTPLSALSLIEDKLHIRAGDIVYDLGCGDGRLLFYCAARHPEARFVGIELNPFLILWMRLRLVFARTRNLEIRRENMLNADFSDATKIYAFLLPHVIARLYSSRTLHSARLLSRAFRISSMRETEAFRITPHDTMNGAHLVYVYDL